MLENQIKELVIKQLKIDENVYDEDLSAGDIPEWDSLGHVNLLMAVENKFEISFDISDAIDIETVSDLIESTRKCLQHRV